MNKKLKERILNILLSEKKKEYSCHIQYVVKIAMEITKKYDVNPKIIETACLLHDIGRGKERGSEKHPQTGKRMAEKILEDSKFNEKEKEKIYACILSHNSKNTPKSIEEQIVRSADAGSKIEYHEAFMLMCKKTSYEERLAWGIKYLEAGFDKISITSYKKKCKPKYTSIKNIYHNTSKII
ncbi:MAG: HD domain-containing protein [Candidatus Komeilibacteria bacterium]|jgi:putative nucleotidyltransferase with HDIG domain|nr:HD domain-containing protein [Candidatus Komeilibacteria bacterium]MBT4447352.1 HD domain-containing protein [Candidatus Komeilibacteria bacterium]